MTPNDAHSLEGATSVMRTLQEEYMSLCRKLVTSSIFCGCRGTAGTQVGHEHLLLIDSTDLQNCMGKNIQSKDSRAYKPIKNMVLKWDEH